MFPAWPAIAFGWPAVLAALLVFVAAVTLTRPALGIVAVILSAPTCLWISGYPRVGAVGLLVLFINALGVIALWRGQRAAATILWAPFLLLAGFLAVLVLRHPF